MDSIIKQWWEGEEVDYDELADYIELNNSDYITEVSSLIKRDYRLDFIDQPQMFLVDYFSSDLICSANIRDLESWIGGLMNDEGDPSTPQLLRLDDRIYISLDFIQVIHFNKFLLNTSQRDLMDRLLRISLRSNASLAKKLGTIEFMEAFGFKYDYTYSDARTWDEKLSRIRDYVEMGDLLIPSGGASFTHSFSRDLSRMIQDYGMEDEYYSELVNYLRFKFGCQTAMEIGISRHRFLIGCIEDIDEMPVEYGFLKGEIDISPLIKDMNSVKFNLYDTVEVTKKGSIILRDDEGVFVAFNLIEIYKMLGIEHYEKN